MAKVKMRVIVELSDAEVRDALVHHARRVMGPDIELTDPEVALTLGNNDDFEATIIAPATHLEPAASSTEGGDA